MRLYEYQAKGILKEYGIPIPKGQITSTASAVEQIRNEIGGSIVIKAQTHKSAKSIQCESHLVHPQENAVDIAAEILDLTKKGTQEGIILIEEAITAKDELFLTIRIEPSIEKPIISISRVEINKTNSNSTVPSENNIYLPIDRSLGLLDFQIRQIAVRLEISKERWDDLFKICKGIWKIFIDLDAESVGLSPLVIDSNNQLLAMGAIIDLDKKAFYRHPELIELQKSFSENQIVDDTGKFKITPFLFSKGNVGCIVNEEAFGIAIYDRARFKKLHIGYMLNIGSWDEEENISFALDLLNRNKKISCILIAIFGDLSRCDRIILELQKYLSGHTLSLPIVLYLKGTNSSSFITNLDLPNLIFSNNLEEALKICADILIKLNK